MRIEKRNCYICDKCSHVTITVDVAEGTTPMTMNCTRPGCTGNSYSFWYRLPPPLAIPMMGKFPATHEWYKPDPFTVKEYEKMHVNNGGLLLRPRTDAKPITLELEKGGPQS
jgi:hypothetical protein